ncbi:MAG: condensation domain-containing protein, partial [Bacteroidota bacterium]
FKRYYKTSALIGTKESCSPMVHQLQQIGIDEIGCLIDFGIAKDKVLEGLVHLGELKKYFTENIQAGKNAMPITAMQSTPSFLKALESDPSSQQFLKTLRLLLIGGEKVPSDLVDKLRERTAAEIYNMYGPTETTIWSSVKRFDETFEKVTVGKPIANTQLYILDRNLGLSPMGTTGELYIGGKGVAQGYWKRAELTSERFIQHPFIDGTLIYKTGDLARWLPNGEVEILGRADEQVKIRGYRIEPGEIESHLRKIPSVTEGVVSLLEKDGDKFLVGYYVADQKITIQELRETLGEKLPDYMIPTFFVHLASLPLTPNGKLDRRRLPDPELEEDRKMVLAATAKEQLLVDVWSEVLGIQNISTTDNFFSVGGDSIKSIQISARVREAGYDLTVKDIFTSQDIRDLALKLKDLETISAQDSIVGEAVLTPIQRWFFDHTTVDSHHYNQSVMLHFPAGISGELTTAIFGKILQHHDALHMVFRKVEDQFVAEYLPADEVLISLEEVNLKRDEHLQSEIIERANEIQASIDMANGPLIKLGLFHTKETSRLLIVVHHLVIDGISWRVLFEDIEKLYQQSINEKVLQLPLKTDSFAAWPEHLTDYMKSSDYAQAHDYWHQQLQIRTDSLVRDTQESVNSLSDQQQAKFTLSKEETSQLLGPIHLPFGTQINDVLLAALFLSVQQQFGHQSLRIDLEGHGREHLNDQINISRTVGWFTSIYSVCFQSSGKELSDLLKNVKEALRVIPNNGLDYLLYRYFDQTVEQNGNAVNNGSQIFFNYLGQFDAESAGNTFSISLEDTGDVISRSEISQYDWDILGLVVDKQLEMRLAYSEKQYKKETIQGVMSAYKNALLSIIDYCTARGSVELTPSDLTYKGFPADLLDTLQSRYELEDIYTLSPMQEGLLFHTIRDVDTDHYFNQITYEVFGELNMEVFRSGLNELINRYDILRTIYLSDEVERPIQVVLKNKQVDFEYIDVREKLQNDALSEVVSDYQRADKQKKFDLSRDTLLRVTILQTAEDQYRVIWSYHHILMDGWCIGIILQEFKEFYSHKISKKALSLDPIKPYANYISWLEKIDGSKTRQYWSEKLAGYESLATLPNQKTNAENIPFQMESTTLALTQAQMDGLTALSHTEGVTSNNVIQSVWG